MQAHNLPYFVSNYMSHEIDFHNQFFLFATGHEPDNSVLSPFIPKFSKMLLEIGKNIQELCNYLSIRYNDLIENCLAYEEDNNRASEEPVLEPMFTPITTRRYQERFLVNLSRINNAFNLQEKQVNITYSMLINAYPRRHFSPFNTMIRNKICYYIFQDSPTSIPFPSPISAGIAVMEALGLFFVLLVLAWHLPYIKRSLPPESFNSFDFTLGSSIFEATYIRPYFIDFNIPISNNSLEGTEKLNNALFIVKDPEQYIASLIKQNKNNLNLFIKTVSSNNSFVQYLKQLSDNEKKYYPIQLLVSRFGESKGETEWSNNTNKLLTATHKKYLSEITRQAPQLREFAPIVQLNIYKQGIDIYNYTNLNRNFVSVDNV